MIMITINTILIHKHNDIYEYLTFETRNHTNTHKTRQTTERQNEQVNPHVTPFLFAAHGEASRHHLYATVYIA